MSKWTRYVPVVCLVAALSAASSVDGHTPAQLEAARGTTVESIIDSRETGIAYRLFIYLPSGYEDPERSFPVIYAMDGDARFDKLVSVLRENRMQAILIGVSCASTERRRVDFTMPGARAYYRFVTTELIPFIEARYRAHHKHRILSGHSLSGQFVVLAMFMEDPTHRYFASYLSSDGSFWYQPSLLTTMEQQMYTKSRRLSVNLVLSGAGNFPYVSSVFQGITRRGYDGLHAKFLNYEGWDHVEMDAPSFKDSMRFILHPAG